MLSRLVKDGVLKRLAHGIYFHPQKDPVLGTIYPSIDDIAQTIARINKVRIMPTGLNALNRLGLSSQVPIKLIYLTDSKPKTIKAGKRTIAFKTTAPKKLSTKGKVTSLVIQALEELGKNGVTNEFIN